MDYLIISTSVIEVDTPNLHWRGALCNRGKAALDDAVGYVLQSRLIKLLEWQAVAFCRGEPCQCQPHGRWPIARLSR